MPWDDAGELFVGKSGQVYFAPIGTALPKPGDDPTAKLAAAFIGTGMLTEDGVTPTFGQEITDYGAWGYPDPVRRDREKQTAQFAFVMQQWNETNLVLALGGKVEGEEGKYSYVPPTAAEALGEWSLVVDAVDGDTHQRFVVPRGNSTDDVESILKRGEPGKLPVTFKALATDAASPSWYLLSDAPGFAVGS